MLKIKNVLFIITKFLIDTFCSLNVCKRLLKKKTPKPTITLKLSVKKSVQ